MIVKSKTDPGGIPRGLGGRSRSPSPPTSRHSSSVSPRKTSRKLTVHQHQLSELASSLDQLRGLTGRKAFEAIRGVSDVVFKIVDRNKTGTLDPVEFGTFTDIVVNQCSIWASPVADFNCMDTSGDRRIDREEMYAFLKAAYKTVGKRQFLAQLAMAADLLRGGLTKEEAEEDIFAELRDTLGCVIPKTEERGITLAQLRKLFNYAERRCVEEQWHDENAFSPTAGDAIQPSTLNLYQLVDIVIKPVTKSRGCSYVEVVAEDAQRPRWFVSHYWGEAVQDFIACLTQHSADRLLPASSPYWVCAYANNQWDLAAEVCEDPADTSFRRAMQLCRGTVSILDQQAMCYTRIWCCYEIWVSIVLRFDDAYHYDFYTVGANGQAVGITDGCAEVDLRTEFPLDAKHKRQRDFPLELCRRALRISLEDAQASREMDRRCILNSIAGRQLSVEPHVQHESYENLNRMLHGLIASASWRCVMEAGEPMDEFTIALRDSDLPKLEVSFDSSQAVSDEYLKTLTATITGGLQELYLDLSFCIMVSDQTLIAIAEAMRVTKKLHKLSLSFLVVATRPAPVTDAGLQVFAEAIPHTLRQLELGLHGCKDLTDVGIQALAAALPRELTGLSLDLSFNGNITSDAVADLAAAVPMLSNLEINLHYCSLALNNETVNAFRKHLYRSAKQVSLDLREGKDITDVALQRFFAALPEHTPFLEELHVNCNMCTSLTDAALPKTPMPRRLRTIALCFGGCLSLTGHGVAALAAALPKELEELTLQFQDCPLLTAESTNWPLADHLPKGLDRFELWLTGCPCAETAKELLEKRLEDHHTEHHIYV